MLIRQTLAEAQEIFVKYKNEKDGKKRAKTELTAQIIYWKWPWQRFFAPRNSTTRTLSMTINDEKLARY